MQSYTSTFKNISDYTGLNFKEIEELDYIEYLVYRRDAWLYNMKQSEKGREILQDLHRLNYTMPSKQTMQMFGGGEF